MKLSREELFSNMEMYNQIYQSLFDIFMKGISKKHKMEYYSFIFNGKTIKGRAVLPVINIDVNAYGTEKRACELFRVEFQDTKCYPDYLLKRHFPEVYGEFYKEVLLEDFFAESEKQVDKLIDNILESNFS